MPTFARAFSQLLLDEHPLFESAQGNPERTLDLFGLRQVLARLRDPAPKRTAFVTPGLYRLVRHPLMTGILLSLWCAPIMTEGRLLLATTMSAYIHLAVKLLEERDLRRALGAEYERYQREVPMVVPSPYKGIRRKSAS